MKLYFCIFRTPKQEEKKIQNLSSNAQILQRILDSLLRCEIIPDSPELMEAGNENLLTADLRVSLSLPAVWIDSLVFICQELGLYNILPSVLFLHGFPLVS